MIAFDRNDRDGIVAHYGYLKRRAAKKFFRPGLDRADLEQIAAIGLLKACDRYDEEQQTPFEAFAWLFVVGELMHYVRDHERLIRPPRRLRSLERRLAEAADALAFRLGRTPSAQELAAHLGVEPEEIQDLQIYRERALPHSLEALDAHKSIRCSYTIEDREDRILLDAALSHLTQTERTIVLAIYAAGYSQIEIARHLGYSRRHISRLHRNALEKMRPFWVSRGAKAGT
jgi:RNA polymerase sigma-B factor